MIKQEHPPTQAQKIQNILSQLNIKSIDQIIQYDHINVDFLAKSTNLHKTIVIQLLFQLQQLINKPQEIVSSDQYSVNLKQIVSQWSGQKIDSTSMQKIKDIQFGSSQILQIIGRANSGKSFFCFTFALHCLQKGLTIIFIDSNQNFQRFNSFLDKKIGLENKAQLKALKRRVISFKYRTLSQFSILMHNLGNQLIQQKKTLPNSLIEKGVVTFIDCLSRIQMADPDTDQQNSTMDFDIIERIKRLLVTYSTRVSSIVYTNRIPTAYTLFNTYYKNQKHRPRCKNNNAKLWDSIANKTIFVQFSMTMQNHVVKKIHFTKDLPNQIFTFEK